MNTYKYIGIGKELTPELLANSPCAAFDTETTGLNTGKSIPLGVSIAVDELGSSYASRDFLPMLMWLNEPDKLIIAHNAPFDRAMLKKCGVTVDTIYDTMVAAHLVQDLPLNLKDLAMTLCSEPINEYKQLPKPLAMMSFSSAAEYSCPHAKVTYKIWEKLYPALIKLGLMRVFTQVETPLIPVLSDMELNGMMLSRPKLEELSKDFGAQIDTIDAALQSFPDCAGVNFNSSDQAADVFFNKFKLPAPRVKTQSGRPSVEAKYLKPLEDKYPIIKMYLMYKGLQKLKSTYSDGLLGKMVGDKIFGHFNQTGTGTGRLSSSEPNLQNIPVRTEDGRKIREAFIAPRGKSVVKADCSQVELKVLAHISKSKSLLEAFNAGRDIHVETALKAYGDAKRRSEAKTLNYKIVFGGGDGATQDLFFKAYPDVKIWFDRTGEELVEAGSANTYFGRHRRIYELDSDIPKIRAHGIREGISTIVQGSTSEFVKIGMRQVWERIHNTDIEMNLQVHDELVFTVDNSIVAEFAQFLYKVMTYRELSVPLTIEVSSGPNWNEQTKIKEEK